LKELEQRATERAVKERKIDESSVSKKFDLAVNEYIEEYFAEAKKDLRSALGVEGDLLEKQTLDENGESEEI
jgi:predicted ribosome quality control (RQC) complex YloA/Tae2 family protein